MPAGTQFWYYVGVPANIVVGIGAFALLGTDRVLWYNLIENIRVPVYVALLGVAAAAGRVTVHTAGLAYAASAGLTLIFVLRVLTRTGVLTLSRAALSLREMGMLLWFGKAPYLTGVLSFLIHRTDLLLVYWFLGERAAGYYSAAVVLADLFRYLGKSLQLVTMPKLPDLPEEARRRVIILLVKATGLALAAASSVYLCAGDQVVGLLYGAEFLPATGPLLWLLPGMLCVGVVQVFSSYFIAMGLVRVLIPITGITLAANIILDVLLIPRFGLTAAALSSSLAYGAQMLLAAGYFGRTTGVRAREYLPRTADWKLLRGLRYRGEE